MVSVTFRFYEELNDFLPSERRRQAFACDCARAATVKHMIEALGVPHTEVELVLLNGESVDFSRPLHDGDRVAVYPRFEALDIGPLLKVRDHPLRELRFIADAHLGGLASLLRMCGFDTLYDNHYEDRQIAALAAEQRRIVLSRDRELLKRRIVTHGCYLHALKPALQLRELFERLDLAGSARPFSRCLHCNLPLHEVTVEQARPRLPPRIAALYSRFFFGCDACQRLYWEGSHWRSMRSLLAPPAGRPPARAGLHLNHHRCKKRFFLPV
ncbi:Mut7-C RNAse domain-containing protein [Azotobacter vinelandii]